MLDENKKKKHFFKLIANKPLVFLTKSRFFCKEVEFLGMVVKEGHVTVNKKKVKKILDLKPPRTLR